MLRAIARLVSRLPGLVLLAWTAVAAVVVVLAPPFEDVVTRDDSAFLSDDAPSVIAAGEASRIWPREEITKSGALVFRRESGLTSGDAGFIRETESWLHSAAAPEEVRITQSAYSRPELRDALLSSDGRVAIVVVGFTTPPFQPRTDAAVEAIRAHTKTGASPGLQVYLTGNAGVAADEATAIDESVHRTTLITLLLVSAILLWVFRSPVAPLVPLVTIGIAFAVSRGLIAIIAGAGLQISALVETFMVVIVFGVGTDYCLFIVSRYREQLEGSRGGDRRRTLVATMAIIGGVIASSAAAVVVGFASQGAAKFGMFRTTGPAMAIAVIVTLAAGLTLTPALLAVLGRWTFWPWRDDKPRSDERATERAAA